MKILNLPEDLDNKSLLSKLISTNMSMSDMMIKIYETLAIAKEVGDVEDLRDIIEFYDQLALIVESRLNDLNKKLREKGKYQ